MDFLTFIIDNGFQPELTNDKGEIVRLPRYAVWHVDSDGKLKVKDTSNELSNLFRQHGKLEVYKQRIRNVRIPSDQEHEMAMICASGINVDIDDQQLCIDIQSAYENGRAVPEIKFARLREIKDKIDND